MSGDFIDSNVFVYLRVLKPLWRVMPSAEPLRSGIDIQDRYQYGFYDSLIVAAAALKQVPSRYNPPLIR